MFGEPIVECVYGWGHILRLYPDHVDIEDVSYSLRDLINFKPMYRCIMGVASMRLDLQFSSGVVVIRGIADISLALKVMAYLNTWSAVTVAFSVEELPSVPELFLPARIEQTPRSLGIPQQFETDQLRETVTGSQMTALTALNSMPLVLSDRSQERFWEYDANEQATTVVGPFDAVVDSKQDSGQNTGVTTPQLAVTLEAVTSWPWTDERHLQHEQRLKRLQTEREMRFYGFDRETLIQRLRDEPLPHVRVPARLLPDEMAHYCTSARLCDEPLTGGRRAKRKVKDQGTLILTNRRLLYLGRKRQIVLEYERVLQASHVPDAVLLSADCWNKPQFFSMRHSLECAMYLERILQNFAFCPDSLLSRTTQTHPPSLVEYPISQ